MEIPYITINAELVSKCSKILGQIMTAIALETVQETEAQQRQQTQKV